MTKLTTTKIATGDALTVLRQLPCESVHCVVTSPPYWLLRDYGVDGQIGLEPNPEDYIARLCQVFDEVRRVLRNDGTCWVVLGDTYLRSAKGAGYNGPSKERFRFRHKPTEASGQAKSLALIPDRFAIEMCRRGWILRNKIIWHKPNSLPNSAKDRFTSDYEELFFFVKESRYYFEQQFEPFAQASRNRNEAVVMNGEGQHGNLVIPGQSPHSMHPKRASGEREDRVNPKGRLMRCVWTIPTARCSEPHFAVYPEALIETPLKAGCPEGGIVLDPFCGSGTTAIVCEQLGRSFIGIELNPAYVEIAKKRIKEARAKLETSSSPQEK